MQKDKTAPKGPKAINNIDLKKIYSLIGSHRKEVIFLTFLSLLSSLFMVAAPYISKLFVDTAFIKKDIVRFINLSVISGAIFIFSTAVRIFTDVARNRITIKLKFRLSRIFIKKFFSLGLGSLRMKSVGEHVYRFSDTGGVSGFLLDQCPNIIADLIRAFVILCICLWLDLRLTLLLLALSPLYIANSIFFQKKILPIYERMWRQSAKLSKVVYEAFSRISIIKVFGLEKFMIGRYVKELVKSFRLTVSNFRWQVIGGITSTFLSKAVFGFIALYGGWLIIKDRLTLGGYTAVMIYLTQLGGLFMSFSHRFKSMAQTAVSLGRFFEIMETEPDIKEAPGAKSLTAPKGNIAFEGLSFGYERPKAVLKDVNLVLPASSLIGVVGPSGYGKTTFINLILRLYDPWQGKIKLDGLDLKAVKLDSLRKNIAVATQEPLLFDATIRDNIVFGLKDIDEKKLIEASRVSCVHEFAIKLPEGYDSLIGENAYRLSEGMKQRVALARAVLRNPPILILDEATSSVDFFTEEKIFLGLKKMRKGLTTIVISHRLFSVRDADRIYFLRDDGKIDEGVHRDLLAQSAPYKEFFRTQAESVGSNVKYRPR